ncbi:hypothetical protein [uncultured Chryseobacterium sp.]|uniref:hypothetical protein n=1 Tax=uncultured Chryseobacterium sp. TaxID=259322 RepID=UPI0025CC6AE6|nr:hypothetical protein [uncultured Chryseobacterium sp.]
MALVTGLKHYLGPFEAYVKAGVLPETPVREEYRGWNIPISIMPRKMRSMQPPAGTDFPGASTARTP